MNFLPVIVVGAGLYALSGKKRRRRSKSSSSQNALPAASGRGEIFKGDSPPDLITNPAGARFSVIFPEYAGTGHEWKLSASPPDNSVAHVKTEYDDVESEGVGGHSSNKVFIFEGEKAGQGSLVFHLVRPWMEGKEPPVEIVEIQTKIS